MPTFDNNSIREGLNAVDPIEGAVQYLPYTEDYPYTTPLPEIPNVIRNFNRDFVESSTNNEERSIRAKQVTDTFSTMVTQLNTQYGLSIYIDFTSFTQTIKSILTPIDKQVFNLVASELYARVRIGAYLKIMSALATLVDEITDTDLLSSPNNSIDEKFTYTERFMGIIKTMEELNKYINVESSDLELNKIKTAELSGFKRTDPAVEALLLELKNGIK